MKNITDKQHTWLVVVNPASGGGKVFKRITEIEQAFAAYKIKYDLRFTQKRGEATEIVQKGIVHEGYRRIMGIGGDGTGNEIINGIFSQTVVPIANIVYTMYAGGTGNDWVKMHQIPNDLKAFCAMILRGCLGKQDVGVLHFCDQNGVEHKRYFANAGGLGYDSFVVQSVEKQTYRLIPKKFAYFLHILKCLFAYKPEPVRVFFDEQVVEGEFYTLNFGINKFAGAGMQLTPQAIKDDGLLALTLIRDIPRWKVVWYITQLYSGAVAAIPEASLFNTPKIRIEHLSQPIYCETDGEFMGATPIEIFVFETQLNVIIP